MQETIKKQRCGATFDYRGSKNTSAAVNNLWLLDLANDRFRSVSGDDLRVVKHVELLCSISAGVEEDSLLSSGVVRKELEQQVVSREFKTRVKLSKTHRGDVKDLTVDDDPHVVLLVMLGHLFGSVLSRCCLANRGGSGGGGRGSRGGLRR